MPLLLNAGNNIYFELYHGYEFPIRLKKINNDIDFFVFSTKN